MTWHSLWAFIFFLPWFALAIYVLLFFKRRSGAFLFSDINLLKKGSTIIFPYLKYVPLVCKLLAVALMIVALARPQIVSSKEKKNADGIDIMLVLDVSDSMLIEDMKPVNRLESAKKTIREFIAGRVSDRIGLVVFSGESYTRVPLTTDYPLLYKSIESIEISRNLKMGTAIGVALANGVARLKDSSAKSRVLILLTDGESNAGTIAPETALDIAKGYGIKIYTIGVGRDGMAQLPVIATDAFGRKIKSYQPMQSKVNDELLDQLARVTGGSYYKAVNTPSLKDVFSKIDSLEKTKVETYTFTKYEEYFETWLLWAIGLYMMGVFLGRTILRRKP